jgi:hypothetical protein
MTYSCPQISQHLTCPPLLLEHSPSIDIAVRANGSRLASWRNPGGPQGALGGFVKYFHG